MSSSAVSHDERLALIRGRLSDTADEIARAASGASRAVCDQDMRGLAEASLRMSQLGCKYQDIYRQLLVADIGSLHGADCCSA